MAIDLKKLKPSVVSKDLKGKYIFLYGPPKIGKTTLAVQFPRNLLLGFEHGWNAIDNVMAVDVPTWTEFKKYVKQLSTDEDLKQQFDTVTVDTIGLAYERCEQYICDRENVDKIGDIPYGAGFKMVDQEFEGTVRKITQVLDETGRTSYGLCLIGHEKVRVEADGTISTTHITPDIPDRCAKIINRLVDMTAYIGIEEDNKRYIYPRQLTIENGNQKVEIFAGSHFADLNDKIELSYQALVDAVGGAMKATAESTNSTLSDSPVQVQMEEKIDFAEVKKNVQDIVRVLLRLDKELDANKEDQHYFKDYNNIVENILGKGKLVKDCTESQAGQLSLILDDLRSYVEKNGITV